MQVSFYTQDEWRELSPNAHLCVFDERADKSTERIDFALIVGNGENPQGYITVKEHDGKTAYMQRGGMFPHMKGIGVSADHFRLCIDWLWGRGFTKVFFNVKNSNIAMIKLGLNTGFRVSGMRQFKQDLLLEMSIEKEN